MHLKSGRGKQRIEPTARIGAITHGKDVFGFPAIAAAKQTQSKPFRKDFRQHGICQNTVIPKVRCVDDKRSTWNQNPAISCSAVAGSERCSITMLQVTRSKLESANGNWYSEPLTSVWILR